MRFGLLIGFSLSLFITSGQTRERFSLNNGVNTYYQVFGSGEDYLLVINGGPGLDSRGFESLSQTLADRYQMQVILFDQRGTGRSKVDDVNSSTMTMDLLLSDMEAIRKQEHIDTWWVFGQSFGGMLASYYASNHPNVMNGLILSSSGGMSLNDLYEVDITGRLTEMEQDSFRYWNQKSSANPSDISIRNRRNEFLASAYLVGNEHIDKVAARLSQVNRTINGLVIGDLQRLDFDCTSQLSSFNKPVLIINGAQDIVSESSAKRAHALFKQSLLVFVSDSGHYGWLENPTEYFGAIDRLFGLN